MANVASLASAALTAGNDILRLAPTWVPRSFKELTLEPGAKCKIKDGGAYGLITVQGYGRIGKLTLQSPSMIRFGAMTEDEVFVTAKAAADGVEFENTGTEPLVSLRYFGPDAQPKAPNVGDHKKK